MTAPVVRANDVVGRRGDATVVDGISLGVDPGDRLLIHGASGAGKTTLFELLALLAPPDAGTIHINGTDTTTLGRRARTRLRRECIGLVYQEFRLLPDLTAKENAVLPHHHVTDPETEWVDTLFRRLGLTEVADHHPPSLSGGEKQRVAVARALANKPSLILADEPTGQLDPDTAKDVLELLLDLQTREGCALIVVSHDNRIADPFDTVYELHNGTLQPPDGST